MTSINQNLEPIRFDQAVAYQPEAPQEEAPQGENLKKGPYAILNPADWTGAKLWEGGRKPYEWLLKDSFKRNKLGVICGSPGVGKGMFMVQMCVAVAAGVTLFEQWEPVAPLRIMYISAEDDEDDIKNRFVSALEELPEDDRQRALPNICAMPVTGLVSLLAPSPAGPVTTENYNDLLALISESKPGLIVLDTLARINGGNENDNAVMTAVCGAMEQIAADYGCNIILTHHTNKDKGRDVAEDEAELKESLTQRAMRGGTGLPGAVRWALLMTPLSKTLAKKVIGDEAEDYPDGTYLAARVAKKNAGQVEDRIYLKRCDHGLLRRVEPEPSPAANSALKDAEAILNAIVDRNNNGLDPLSRSRAGVTAFSWGITRSQKAVTAGLENGLFITVKKEGGKGAVGEVLAVPIVVM